MTAPCAQLSIWITELAGKAPLVDRVMSLLSSDFFVPVSMSLVLLFLWFGTGDATRREQNQWGAICASLSIGIANLAVWLLNHVFKFDPWPRPFGVHESARQAVEIVFYMPHDPSFPANISAVTFAAATGMWFYNHKASIPIFILAILWSFARIYAGVHYPLDILGGAVIGVIIAYVSYRFMLLVRPVPIFLLGLARKLYLA
ncbi:phosphatase PAP2 family protein [Dehalococcoidia bacterium]|nr:phosphatase PAP2 family protein [Dehalococcoidia bacterium]